MAELAGDTAFTTPQYWECERVGRDRADLNDYKLKIKAAVCFSLKTQLKEYYHNSSFLEHGARRKGLSQRLCQPDQCLSESQ